jgi:hypothetical protein
MAEKFRSLQIFRNDVPFVLDTLGLDGLKEYIQGLLEGESPKLSLNDGEPISIRYKLQDEESVHCINGIAYNDGTNTTILWDELNIVTIPEKSSETDFVTLSHTVNPNGTITFTVSNTLGNFDNINGLATTEAVKTYVANQLSAFSPNAITAVEGEDENDEDYVRIISETIDNKVTLSTSVTILDDIQNATEDNNGLVTALQVKSAAETAETNAKGYADTVTETAETNAKSYTDTKTTLQNDLVVQGVNVGNAISGETTFEAGQSFEEILREILQKKVSAKQNTVPTVKFNGITKTTYEVGETIPEVTLTTSMDNKGNYISSDTNVYTLTGGEDSNGVKKTASNGLLNAECTITDGPTYALESNNISVTLTDNVISSGTAKEGTCYKATMSCKVSSDITPYNNVGELVTDVKFTDIAKTANKTIIASYKYFYGYCAYNPSETYATLITSTDDLSSLTSGNCNTDTSTNTIDKMESTNGKTSMVLVIPSNRQITYTKDSMGNNVFESWKKQNTFKYVKNTTETDYDVYVLSSSGTVSITDIKFNK